jgi:hypothetical protein
VTPLTQQHHQCRKQPVHGQFHRRSTADGTLFADPLDLSEPVWGVALHGNIIVTAVGGDIAIHQPAAP